MDTIPTGVLRRFLARHVLSDDKFRPPKSVVNAVETGRLDTHVLLFWKDVVEKISAGPGGWKGSASYSAAIAYWRNKCGANGYPLPNEYIEGLGGKGSQGRWSVKAGDEIEDWVKQTMTTAGLMGQVAKSVAEWQMEIQHLERLLNDAQGRVEKHQAALGSSKSERGVAQKRKWLEEAAGEVDRWSKDLAKAKEQLGGLTELAAKKAKTESYAIEFEREMQFQLIRAAKDLDKKTILDCMIKAVQRFEKGLEIPGPYQPPPGAEMGMAAEASVKTADVLDYLAGFLVKAWNYLRGSFDLFTDWLADVSTSTKKIDELLAAVGAEE